MIVCNFVDSQTLPSTFLLKILFQAESVKFSPDKMKYNLKFFVNTVM